MESSSRLAFFSSEGELLGESSSPFIVEGDSLTSQRKRERERVYVCDIVLLPTLSGTRRLSVPTILFMFRLIWQALPCSPSTINVGAYNTVCVLTRLEGCIVPI